MNVIRINWPLIRRLLLALFFIYLIYTLILYITFKNEPTLTYNYLKQEFQVDRRWTQINNLTTFVPDLTNKETVGFQIKSSLIKYTKVPVEYWSHLCENTISLGLNTVEIEIVWGAHEPSAKIFDYVTGPNDLNLIIDLVGSYNLFLIVRIDPYYHCSDYDLGGLPNWLLGDLTLEQRETASQGLLTLKDQTFKDSFKNWLDSFLWLINEKQAIYGGPIIAVLISQYLPELGVETNDLIRFYNDEYVGFIQSALDEHSIVEVLLRSVDNCEVDDESLFGLNCDRNLRVYLPVVENEEEKKRKMTEFKQTFVSKRVKDNYCSDSMDKYWSTDLVQNQKRIQQMESPQKQTESHKQSLIDYKSNLVALSTKRRSFNIKNFFYDINLGFTQASHQLFSKPLNPLLMSSNSINSNFLIRENLELSDKYWLTQQIVKSELNYNKIRIRDNPKNYRQFLDVDLNSEISLKMSHFLSYKNMSGLLLPQLFWRKHSELYFEFISSQNRFEQHKGFGYMVYRMEKNLTRNTVVYINTKLIKDYALVICNLNETIARIDNVSGRMPDVLMLKLKNGCQQFDVIVESMGRLSDVSNGFNKLSKERKGILTKSAVQFKLPNTTKFQIGNFAWKVYWMDFNKKLLNRLYLNSDWLPFEMANKHMELDKPLMTFARFNVIKKGGTNTNKKGMYLMLPGTSWSKGTVFINNFNLGRYWSSIGPLCTLFIPEFLLYEGVNEIMIFDMHKSDRQPLVYFTSSHVIL